MKKFVVLLILVLIFGGGYLLVKQPTKTPVKDMVTEQSEKEISESKILSVPLTSQNGSGQDGVATLQEVDGKLKVLIAVASTNTTPQPAHIHIGSCPNPGAVKYPLTNVVSGKSETVLDIDMKTLLSDPKLAINVHKSAKEASVYTACGDIK